MFDIAKNELMVLEVGMLVYCDGFGHGAVKQIRTRWDDTQVAVVHFEGVDAPQVYTLDGRWDVAKANPHYDLQKTYLPKSKFARNYVDYVMWGSVGFAAGYACHLLTTAFPGL